MLYVGARAGDRQAFEKGAGAVKEDCRDPRFVYISSEIFGPILVGGDQSLFLKTTNPVTERGLSRGVSNFWVDKLQDNGVLGKYRRKGSTAGEDLTMDGRLGRGKNSMGSREEGTIQISGAVPLLSAVLLSVMCR